MKKTGLVIALFLLFISVSWAAVPDDKNFKTGLQYYNAKNYKAAVKQFSEYVNRKPDPTAYYLIGYSLYKLGKFSEADDYFKEAYLIDPEFSLEKVGLVKKSSGEITDKAPAAPKERAGVKEHVAVKGPDAGEKPAPTPAPRTEAPKAKPAPAATPVKQNVKPTVTAATPVASSVQVPPAKQIAKPAGSAQVPAATPKQPAPQPQATPAPKPAPSIPDKKTLPTQPLHKQPGAGALVAIPMIMGGLFAGFALVFLGLGLAIYFFVAFCLYRIALRLHVPYPWTAWIPIVNIWTLVASAGKPVWWLILCIIPIINIFVFIYLYMCVTENLGKNKWLGLLMVVPLVNLGYLGWLAFSQAESPASSGM
jgi:hypothetical protein